LATVSYSARAQADLDRLFDFLVSEHPAAARGAADRTVDAVRILERRPYIGRPGRGRLRELTISHGRSGYVALYRVTARRNPVEVLAVRHQREAGYHS
jgi:plasmid stabilization system protein ParE